VPGLPAGRRRERRGVDLQRPREAFELRAPACEAGPELQQRHRHERERHRAAERAGERADERRRRDGIRVGDEVNAGRRGRRVERCHDRVAQVREPEDAAPVVDRADRQRAPRLDRVDEPRDVAARARAYHERQPQHDRRGRRSPAGVGERDLGVALAAPVGVRRGGRIAGAEKPSRERRVAVDLDARREHEPRHLRCDRRKRETGRGVHVRGTVRRLGAGAAIAQHVRARGEVHDRLRTVEHALERLGRRLLQRTQRDGAFDSAAILAHDRPHLAPGRAQAVDDSAPDEPRRAGDDDQARRAHRVPGPLKAISSRACGSSAIRPS
jgi:hypothetical protein